MQLREDCSAQIVWLTLKGLSRNLLFPPSHPAPVIQPRILTTSHALLQTKSLFFFSPGFKHDNYVEWNRAVPTASS